jgi:phage baseplate assembly protein gpV
MTDSIVRVMQKVAEQEVRKIYSNELGIVTSIFPHAADSDKDNYQCSVKLKNRKQPDGSNFELRRVPVVTQHIGLANIPNVGDLVVVGFINGDLNAPVILGRLYNDEDAPPQNDVGQLILSKLSSLSISLNSGTKIEIDADGNVKVEAPGNVTINGGNKGAARQDDSVEVTIPSGTFITTVTGGSGAPAVGTPNPAPVKVQGKITSASNSIKIG